MFQTLNDASMCGEEKIPSSSLVPDGDIKAVLQKLDELKELFKKNITTSSHHNKDSLLTISQTSQYCGFSKSFLYKLSASQEVSFYKPNQKNIFFRRGDIDDFLTRKKILSVGQIKEQAEQQLELKLFTSLKTSK